MFSFLSAPHFRRLTEPRSVLPESGPNQSSQIRAHVLEEVRVGSLPASQLDEAVSVYLILSDRFCSWISVNEEHVCMRGPDLGLESCSHAQGTVLCRAVRYSEDC